MTSFLQGLAGLYPNLTSDRERLLATFGIGRFVHLSREDKVAQAVSLVLAAQTGLWHRNADGTERERAELVEPARYNEGLIAKELDMLTSEERGWNTWFSTQSITPLRLTYEELARAPLEKTRSVLEHIGSRSDAALTVGTAKLATSLNQEWAQRFRSNQR